MLCNAIEVTIIQCIKNRLYKDRRLKKAITELELTPIASGLVLQIKTCDSSEVFEKIAYIVRVVLSIAPIQEVVCDGTVFSVGSFSSACNSIAKPVEGNRDRKLNMQQVEQKQGLIETTIAALQQSYTVMLLTPAGLYAEVYYHAGTKAMIPAEDLVGNTLLEILGEASASTVLECMADARKLNKPIDCFYDVRFGNDRRWYQGRAFPLKEGCSLQLFLVKRLNPDWHNNHYG